MTSDPDAWWLDAPTRSAAESPCWLCASRCVLRAHLARAWVLHDELRDRGLVSTTCTARTAITATAVADLLRRVGFHPRTHGALIARGPTMAKRDGYPAHPSHAGDAAVWALPWVAALWALDENACALWGRVLRARPRLRQRFGLIYQLAGDIAPARQYLAAMEPSPAATSIRAFRRQGFVPVAPTSTAYGRVWNNLAALVSAGEPAIYALCANGSHPETGVAWVWVQAWFAAVGVHTSADYTIRPVLVRRHALVRVPGLRARVETVTRLEGPEAGTALLDAYLVRVGNP